MDNKTRFQAELDEWFGVGVAEIGISGVGYRAVIETDQWSVYVHVSQIDEYSVSAGACGLWVRDHSGVHEAMAELSGKLVRKAESIYRVVGLVGGV